MTMDTRRWEDHLWAAQDDHVRNEERRRIMTGDWLTEPVADFVERITAAVARS